METALSENYAYHRARGSKATAALIGARADLASGKRRYGACTPRVRFNPLTKEGTRWVENAADGLRLVGYADEIARDKHSRAIDHTGWFTDEFGDTSIRGIVYRLPHGRFAYGSADPNNDGAALLMFGKCDNVWDAAVWADQFAEREAEDAREYNEAWQAGRDYYERLPQEIAEIRRRFLTLAAKSPSLDRDAANTRWLEEIAEEWTAKRKERQEVYNTFHRQPGFKD